MAGTLGGNADAPFLPAESMQFVARNGGPEHFHADAAAFLKSQGRQGFDCVLDSLVGSYFEKGEDELSSGCRDPRKQRCRQQQPADH